MSSFLATQMQRASALLIATAIVLAALGPLAVPQATRAVSPDVVISQVYGGGGNSGATLTHDFIELYNRGASAVDISGWSVQYASATGTSWQRTNLVGTIQPDSHYLVQQAKGSGGTTALPTPDAVGTIAMAASSGKVALLTNQVTLPACGSTAVPCMPNGAIRDFVGFGSASEFEGSGPTGVLSNTTAAHRAGNGAIDTDNNAADFTVDAPNPRNSGKVAASLGATGSATPASVQAGAASALSVAVTPAEDPDSTGITVMADLTPIGGSSAQPLLDADGDLVFTFDATVASGTVPGTKMLEVDVADAEGRSAETTISLTVEVPIEIVPIGFIQGSVAEGDDGLAHRSQFAPASSFQCSGELFTIQGVVTQRIRTTTSAGAANYGFFVQNTAETSDGDPNSSDGLFVYTSTFPTVLRQGTGSYFPVVGDEVVLRGRVAEYFNFTQFCNGGLRLIDEVAEDRLGFTELTDADPSDDLAEANRFWERRESMRFSLPAESQVVAGRSVFASTADAEVWVIRGDHPVAQRDATYTNRVFRDPHPLDDIGPAGSFDNGNGYRIMLTSHGLKWLENDGGAMLAPARTFDTVENAITGSLYFSFGKYGIEAEQQLDLGNGADPSLNAPPAEPDREFEYSTAVYNVENLYDFRDDPFDGCDFAGNGGCTGVNPPFDYVPASDAAYQAQLANLADQIANDLHGPDILLIQEAEDQDICTVDAGSLTCSTTDDADGKPDTLQELALVIGAQHGIPYDAAYDRDGADDRGIVNGFLYRTDRVELLAADASDPVLGDNPRVHYAGAGLAYNTDLQNPKALNAVLPAGIELGDGCQASKAPGGRCVFTRDAQVGLFRVWRDGVGESVFTDLYAITNHFSSGPDGRVEQRTEQAAYNAALVEALGEGARAVVGGDFNVFPRPDDPFPPPGTSDQLAALYEIGLHDLWAVVAAEAPESAYSYVFTGQAQTLDNQFTTDALYGELNGVRFAHVNADFPANFGGDGSRGASDHDPQAARYAATTPDALTNLVLYLFDAGAIDESKVDQLLSRIERVERLADGGEMADALDQLEAFGNQVDGLSPRWIDPDAAEILRLEAEVLASSL